MADPSQEGRTHTGTSGKRKLQDPTPSIERTEPESQALLPLNREEGIEERWFLALGSKIVGVQHSDGVVSDRESVVLRRQPSNIYDRNAIQASRAKPVKGHWAFKMYVSPTKAYTVTYRRTYPWNLHSSTTISG